MPSSPGNSALTEQRPPDALKFYGGTEVLDFDFTKPISEALIKPLTVTSVRKFELLIVAPEDVLVWPMPALLTEPLPVVLRFTSGERS